MSVLPESRLDQLQFFESHVSVWGSAPPTALGLTASQVAALGALTSAARTAYTQMQAQHQAAKASTGTWYDAHDLMRNMGADLIKVIKAYAAATNNPGVYNSAQIPAPKSPTPTPAPSTPTNVVASLQFSGAIGLSWTSSVANGTAFSVWRKLNQSGQAFEQIATVSGTTEFVDQTLPAGAGGSAGNGVLYAVQAHRLGLSSELSEPALIRFGSVDGESGGEELKIAA